MVTNSQMELDLHYLAMGYYANSDSAHMQDHIELVKERAYNMYQWLNDKSIDLDVILCACTLHDIGSCRDREKHAEESYKIYKTDKKIQETVPQEIERKLNIAYCILQHSSHFAGEYYSKEAEVVASADRDEPDIYNILYRSTQYGKKHFPDTVVEDVSEYNIKRYAKFPSKDYRVPDWHYAYWNTVIPDSIENLNKFFSNEDAVKKVVEMIYNEIDEYEVRKYIKGTL